MPKGFMKVRFNVTEKDDDELWDVGTRGLAQRGVGRSLEADNRLAHFNNDESAARYYLRKVLAHDDRPAVRGLRSEDDTQATKDAHLVEVQEQQLTKTSLVRFEQTRDSIPIFGSQLVVELDQNRELVSLTGGVADIKGVPPVASLSPVDALKRISALTGVDEELLGQVQPPELTFFHDDEKDSWHLAYFFKKVPAAPDDFMASVSDRKSHGHGLGISPREHRPRLNYLVDAHSGSVLFYFSAAPLVDVPVKCKGVGELGVSSEFWGRQVEGGFSLSDPLRFIDTYDHTGNDLENDPLPGEPVLGSASDWKSTNRAAVSAHVNATRVYDFYNSVLMRDGIDDKGMDLVSIVNCTYSEAESPPEWHNAVWYDNRMWYGQDQEEDEPLRSYSRYLDVIAHELTHGVTEYTSDLVYHGQSGALNESFSDIFGVIIANWHNVGPDSDVELWNWELGPGLGPNGLPLRDLSNPKRTDDPDHMDDFLDTHLDSGGVHTNSNIHNKAAYNLLTARDDLSQRVFSPREISVLLYLCLSRLERRATFVDALDSLVDVATVYYAGNEDERDEKIKHILSAYESVGINSEGV